MMGILGGQWELSSFRPMGQIPTAVRLTSYSGGVSEITREQLQQYVSMVENGQLEILRGPMCCFDQLPVAHQRWTRIGRMRRWLALGGKTKDCVTTLVERTTGYAYIGKLRDRSKLEMSRRTKKLIRGSPGTSQRSL
jgi:IS30 family transposase